MLGVRFSLFTKIIVWLFLNLLLLSAILLVFFSFNFRYRPNSDFSGGFGNNIEAVTRQITIELDDKTREERDAILKNYAEKYPGVEFFLFDNKGSQLGGGEINLPPEIFNTITSTETDQLPPEMRPKLEMMDRREPPPPMPGARPPAPPSIYLRTMNPTLYWFTAKAMTYQKGEKEPVRTRFLAVSDSFYGYGLFFNPFPWLILTGIIITVSVLFWLPFVRSITKSIGQMTTATGQIAEENFDVRIGENRTDELGKLGKSINYLTGRLSGFVSGQKRFLGDISHELNSPLARMNFALTILEDRVDEKNRTYVEDVKEEVELMSKLVAELLVYSKAGIKTAQVELKTVRLSPIVERIVKRETVTENAEIEVEIEKDLEVLAQPELLSRAISNIVRNAVRYAGNAGLIKISAEKADNQAIEIIISDSGAGVPENALDKIFDPLYRVESDRSRQTGGTGLGLAIVKTCVEACRGKVSARNIQPRGFEISIILKKPLKHEIKEADSRINQLL